MLLTAVSLALGDKGDATAALAKAALSLQHAEAFALQEGEAAEAARGVLNEVGGGLRSRCCCTPLPLMVGLFLILFCCP